MRVDDIQGHHIKSRRAAGSSTAMGTPVADPGVRPAIRRLTDRYPALCLLALTLAGLGVTVRALAWILSHDGCSHPVGAVVAVLALAGCGVFAFAPVLMLMASQVGWLFPEDSQREYKVLVGRRFFFIFRRAAGDKGQSLKPNNHN